MHRNKQIAIILPDTLQSIGLQSLLTDYFPPVEVCYFPAFEIFNAAGGNDAFDYYFTSPDIMVVFRLIFSLSAISLFVMPLTISWRTSVSREERSLLFSPTV